MAVRYRASRADPFASGLFPRTRRRQTLARIDALDAKGRRIHHRQRRRGTTRGGVRRRAPDRSSVAWRAVLRQGPHPHCGVAHHPRLGGASTQRARSRRADRDARMRDAGAIVIGKANTPRVRAGGRDIHHVRPACVQSARSHAYDRRVERRDRSRDRGRHERDRARQRRRRFDSPARRVVRRQWPQTDLRACAVRGQRAAGRSPERDGRPYGEDRRRPGAHDGHHRRTSPRRPHVITAAESPLSRRRARHRRSAGGGLGHRSRHGGGRRRHRRRVAQRRGRAGAVGPVGPRLDAAHHRHAIRSS